MITSLTKAALAIVFLAVIGRDALAQEKKEAWHYTVTIPDPATHICHVELHASINKDTALLKMPEWMPGYYQIMDYSDDLENFQATDAKGKAIHFLKSDDHTWQVNVTHDKPFVVTYDIRTHRQFVASSYVDSTRAYLIPENTFLYMDGHLGDGISVKVAGNESWKNIATGLDPVKGKSDEFTAPDFDVLYDCPILVGNLEELPSFQIKGVLHRFIGYDLGDFDRGQFMANLKKIVEAGTSVIGDIPYKQYTFIAIGSGRGGIEHLNNTTVSFNGAQLNSPEGMNRMMNFLAHEYFHNYNVKRIRPFELGPFDYEHGSKTNLLWVSEGLSVYYEYMLVKRAGLISDSTLFADFDSNINNIENNPGRLYESLTESSYRTWAEGPQGNAGRDAGKTISYYEKGPIVGLLLDFAIRNATHNKTSLDDVMRMLYWKYYKVAGRGFTDAEFQEACEEAAGTSLAPLFEFVYTTKELDYNRWLNPGGLKVDGIPEHRAENKKTEMRIGYLDTVDSSAAEMREDWLHKK